MISLDPTFFGITQFLGLKLWIKNILENCQIYYMNKNTIFWKNWFDRAGIISSCKKKRTSWA